MYPRNNASPERLAIGPVVQISDGAVQTSGVSIKVTPQGGTAAAGSGSTDYVEGIVHYTPTQAETNYTSFTITAYKSGCIPCAITVVTTASPTPGQVYVGTNADKTGYGLADDAITAAKFDESTAYPLKQADTGSTAVARAGADGDTLKTLSDQLDTIDDYVDTEVAAILEDTSTTIPATLALLATAANLATVNTVVDAIKVVTDALTAAAAGKLALSAGTIVSGTVSHDNTPATTTVFYSDDITEATADHFNGRIVIFTSGALQYQATDITDYELSAGEGKFTVTALTESPADDVTFIIV